MEIPLSDAINSRADEVAEWLHSVIDIPESQPNEESTDKIHFDIPHTLAKSISEEDHYKHFKPGVVSIGPFCSNVAPMGNNSKRKAVKKLAERVKTFASIEQVYASVEQDLLRITKECYHVSALSRISEREWCLKMFLDGCFIVEFISNNILSGFGRRSSLNMKRSDRDLVLRDLLLFQNQMPFQVLDVLARAFQCHEFDLLMMLFQIPLFKRYSYTKDRRPLEYRTQAPPLHLLQYYRDLWISVLYNLVAYEFSRSFQNRSFGISSYLKFMNWLINGEEDVKELRDRGLLQLNHKVGNDIQVVNFLRDITAHLEPNPQEFKDVKRQIFTYLETKRLPLRIGYAEFKQRYFSGPWNFFVFLAVIFTVSMTVIQTVFTGIQTYKKD